MNVADPVIEILAKRPVPNVRNHPVVHRSAVHIFIWIYSGRGAHLCY